MSVVPNAFLIFVLPDPVALLGVLEDLFHFQHHERVAPLPGYVLVGKVRVDEYLEPSPSLRYFTITVLDNQITAQN